MQILPRSTWTDLPNRWVDFDDGGPLEPSEVDNYIAHWPGDGARSRAGITQEQAQDLIAGYDRFHRETRGWRGIGYSFIIDLEGRIYEGAGLHRAAHTAGLNFTGIGVLLLLGEGDAVSGAMADAFEGLREDLQHQGYPLRNVIGHSQAPGATTTCPGPHALAYLAEGPATKPVDYEKPYFVNPVEGRVSSEYGMRFHPIFRQGVLHRGIDIAAPVGTPIYAAFAGVVRAVRTDSWRGDTRGNPITGTWNTGNYILIDGPGGGSEWYGHPHTVHVRPGEKVEVGQQIGTVGVTGNVTGPHLHFETWAGRTGETAINPRIAFARYGVTPGVGRPEVFLVANPVTEKPSPPKKSGPNSGNSKADNIAIARTLNALGYPYSKPDGVPGDYLAASVRAYQAAQRYKPGVGVDGDWGPKTQEHYEWTKVLQAALNRWKGSDVRVDGDYGRATEARVLDVMRRNRGGTYKGVVDGIPGPVFCKMLGIPTHPGR